MYWNAYRKKLETTSTSQLMLWDNNTDWVQVTTPSESVQITEANSNLLLDLLPQCTQSCQFRYLAKFKKVDFARTCLALKNLFGLEMKFGLIYLFLEQLSFKS